MSLTPIDYHHLSNLYKRASVEVLRTGDQVHIDMIFDGTLDECVVEFMKKPVSQRPLYEVHTVLQSALGKEILVVTNALNEAASADVTAFKSVEIDRASIFYVNCFGANLRHE